MSKTASITFYILFVMALFIAGAVCVFNFLYPQKYEDYITNYAQKYDLEPALVASVINVESGYDENAKSSAGAIGLMQIIPATASYLMGEEISEEELFDAEFNIEIGCLYLAKMLSEFANLETALAGYNAGPSNVKNWLNDEKFSSDGQTLISTPYAETNRYIEKVKNNIKIYDFLMN